MTTTIRPPDEMHRDLRRAAKLRGLTFNHLVLLILWDWLKQNPPSRAS